MFARWVSETRGADQFAQVSLIGIDNRDARGEVFDDLERVKIEVRHRPVRRNGDIEATYEGRDGVMRLRTCEHDPPVKVRCRGTSAQSFLLRSGAYQQQHRLWLALRRGHAGEHVEQVGHAVPWLHASRETDDESAVEAGRGHRFAAAEGRDVRAIRYPFRGHARRDRLYVAQQRG